jgi:hypothetical protein
MFMKFAEHFCNCLRARKAQVANTPSERGTSLLRELAGLFPENFISSGE